MGDRSSARRVLKVMKGLDNYRYDFGIHYYYSYSDVIIPPKTLFYFIKASILIVFILQAPSLVIVVTFFAMIMAYLLQGLFGRSSCHAGRATFGLNGLRGSLDALVGIGVRLTLEP